MISRKTAMAIADAYTKEFSHISHSSSYSGRNETVYREELYDWLYERDYQAWFCNLSRKLFSIRGLKDHFLKIHTGETLVSATPEWPWDKRKLLGQQQLENLTRDFLAYYQEKETDTWFVGKHKTHYDEILRRIEMDGYVFRNGMLLMPEVDILDVEAERGLLHDLHASLNLGREKHIFSFLDLSEKHYIQGDWSDSIGNARKFFEAILQEVALRHATYSGTQLDDKILQRPVSIRDYLEHENLLEKRERETLDKIYGLLSHTGSHPYMAEKDQARLLRQLSLTLTQFILLRLEGYLRTNKNPS